MLFNIIDTGIKKNDSLVFRLKGLVLEQMI